MFKPIQVRVPKHLDVVSKSRGVRIRAKHTEKDGTVVYTVVTRNSAVQLEEVLTEYAVAG